MTTEVVETQICTACEEPKPLALFREGKDVDVCEPCRYGSIVIGLPSDHPTRTQKHVPREVKGDPLAAGIPTDNRNMPWLSSNLEEMRMREVHEKRHLIDTFERDKRNGLFDQKVTPSNG